MGFALCRLLTPPLPLNVVFASGPSLMPNMRAVPAIVCLSSLVLPALALTAASLPLRSLSRWIVDPAGNRVKLRCVNWAGHLEVNIPEGLDKQPVDAIADWVAGQGFNCVRLTYAIDMALDQDVSIQDSFRRAARDADVSPDGMMERYEDARKRNPWVEGATRIDAFDRVQGALWDRGVVTILDNHVSKAKWCCGLDDGNGWWEEAPIYYPPNSEYFIAADWEKGLRAMAEFSLSRRGIVGMSLRNELRSNPIQMPFSPSYWYRYMPIGARAIHETNPDLLVIHGGINGGTDLTPLRLRDMDLGDWADKRVWEAHQYRFTVLTPNVGSCAGAQAQYGLWYGFVLKQGKSYTGPLWLSEFGVAMTGGNHSGLSSSDYQFLACLRNYMEGNDADWALWALQGSYYVREGVIDSDEGYGALSKDWEDWRNPEFPALLGSMMNVTQGPGV